MTIGYSLKKEMSKRGSQSSPQVKGFMGYMATSHARPSCDGDSMSRRECHDVLS